MSPARQERGRSSPPSPEYRPTGTSTMVTTRAAPRSSISADGRRCLPALRRLPRQEQAERRPEVEEPPAPERAVMATSRVPAARPAPSSVARMKAAPSAALPAQGSDHGLFEDVRDAYLASDAERGVTFAGQFGPFRVIKPAHFAAILPEGSAEAL